MPSTAPPSTPASARAAAVALAKVAVHCPVSCSRRPLGPLIRSWPAEPWPSTRPLLASSNSALVP